MRPRRWPLLLGAGLLVVLIAFVARAAPYAEPPAAPEPTAVTVVPPVPGTEPLPTDDATARAQDEQNRALGAIGALQGITLLYVGALLLVVVIGVQFALWWLRDSWRLRSVERTGRGRPTVGDEPAADLPRAVVDAQLVLDQGPARDAVIACWLLLQRAGHAAGTTVRDSDTAAEYAARLAREQLISEPPLLRLADLYREARFSDHVLGADLRAAARRQLTVLQAELGSGVRL